MHKLEMANSNSPTSGILVLLCTSAFTTLVVDNLLFSILPIAERVGLAGATGTANGKL